MEQKVKITWLGTAAIRLEADGETVLFDPFVQLVGGENPNCLDDFLQDQTICVTHGHLDHLMRFRNFWIRKAMRRRPFTAEKWRQRRFPIWWRTPAT